MSSRNKTVAEYVPFDHLCKICDKMKAETSNEDKKRKLREFITEWRSFHAKVHGNDPQTEDSFYPAIRLLLPKLDKERGPYGFKEKKLAQLYIKLLGLAKDSREARTLSGYTAPTTSGRADGDFATIAYFILKNRCPDKPVLTIAQVNDHLDGIALANAQKDEKAKETRLSQLLLNTSATEQKWLIRMLLGDMRGISEKLVFDIYHPDAQNYHGTVQNLQKVCRTLQDPDIRLNEVEVELFSPCRPMLSERTSPDKVQEMMKNRPFFIETKYDGERMQLHKKGPEFMYFSRNGFDFTDSFGASKQSGSLTPFIFSSIKPECVECILDGEMVIFHKADKYIGSKAQKADVKALKPDSPYQPCFCVYDILLYNSTVLTNKPLRQRKTYISKVFSQIEGRIHVTHVKDGKTNLDAANALNLAIENREEGIILKDPESIYQPHQRNRGWCKIKPDYVDGLLDTLDLIIAGGFYGTGRRRNIVSHFLMAVAVPPETKGDYPRVFHTICRVGTGYTDEDLKKLLEKLAGHWKPFDKNNPPRNLKVSSKPRDRPDVCIDPEKSVIVEIKAAEIMDSDQFRTGHTLRHPRVERVRDDKSWYDCMTTVEFDKLRTETAGRLTKRQVNDDENVDEELSPAKKKQKGPKPNDQVVTVASQYKGIDFSSVEKISTLFAGKKFLVHNMSKSCKHSKASIETAVVKHGGKVTQNPDDDTFCVLAESDYRNAKLDNIIKGNNVDVVKIDWLIDCIDQNRIKSWTPFDMVHTTPRTSRLLARDFDPYGNSYTEETTPKQLKKIFDSIPDKVVCENQLSTSKILELEEKYSINCNLLRLFRRCKAYLDVFLIVGDAETKIPRSPLELVAINFRFYGGSICTAIEDDVTHVMVDSKDLSRISELDQLNRQRQKRFHVVTEEWTKDCIKREELIRESSYGPNIETSNF